MDADAKRMQAHRIYSNDHLHATKCY